MLSRLQSELIYQNFDLTAGFTILKKDNHIVYYRLSLLTLR